MHLLHKSLLQQTRDRQVEERQRHIFLKWHFDISHTPTELSASEPLPKTEQDVLYGTICGKHKSNYISQLPPHQLRMLFAELFLKMMPITGKEAEQVLKAVIYFCLLNFEKMLSAAFVFAVQILFRQY